MEDKYRNIIQEKFNNLEGVPPIGGWSSIQKGMAGTTNPPVDTSKPSPFRIPLLIVAGIFLFLGGYFFGTKSAKSPNNAGLAQAEQVKTESDEQIKSISIKTTLPHKNNGGTVEVDQSLINESNSNESIDNSSEISHMSYENDKSKYLVENLKSSKPAETTLMAFTETNDNPAVTEKNNEDNNQTFDPNLDVELLALNTILAIADNGTSNDQKSSNTNIEGQDNSQTDVSEGNNSNSAIDNSSEQGFVTDQTSKSSKSSSNAESNQNNDLSNPIVTMNNKEDKKQDNLDSSKEESKELADKSKKEEDDDKKKNNGRFKVHYYGSIFNSSKYAKANQVDDINITGFRQTAQLSSKKMGMELGLKLRTKISNKFSAGFGVEYNHINDDIEYNVAGNNQLVARKLSNNSIRYATRLTEEKYYDIQMRLIGLDGDLRFKVSDHISLVGGLGAQYQFSGMLIDTERRVMPLTNSNGVKAKLHLGASYLMRSNANWDIEFEPSINYYPGKMVNDEFITDAFNAGVRINLIRK